MYKYIIKLKNGISVKWVSSLSIDFINGANNFGVCGNDNKFFTFTKHDIDSVQLVE